MAQVKHISPHFVGFREWPADKSDMELPVQLYNIEPIASALAKAIPATSANASVLEIGCYMGGSLQRWANVLSRISQCRRLIAVDPYDNPGNYLGDVEPCIKSVKEVLEFYGNGEFHQVKSDDFFASKPKCLENGLAFALVDGWHGEEQMKRDFINTAQYMVKGGLLVLDDLSWVDGLDVWVSDYFNDHKISWLPGGKPAGPLVEHHQAIIFYE